MERKVLTVGKSSLTKTEVSAKFASGLNCSQCVIGQMADRLGYDEDELYKMAAAFGGGMTRGDTCGAVTGALMAIGMLYGGEGAEANAKVHEKTAAFHKAFRERYGTTMCREMLGYDFSKPGERDKAIAAGKMAEVCPGAVAAALEILDDITRDV